MRGALAAYGRVLRTPYARPLVLSSLVARLPAGVLTVALIIFLRAKTGSYATAGGLAGVFALAGGCTAPLQGRLIDRLGQSRVLAPLALLNAASVAALVPLGAAGASPAVLGIACALAGLTWPPFSSCLRALWPGLLDDSALITTAYALDAILVELVFVVGPAATAFVLAVGTPEAALLVSAGCVLAGGLWFAALEPSRQWRPSGERHGLLGALASPGMRTLALGSLAIGLCFGSLEVALPAIASEFHERSVAAVLLALQGAGSALGGFAYGALAERLGGHVRSYLALLVLSPATFALLVLPHTLWLLALVVIVTGTAFAPITVAASNIAARVAPPGTTTEAFTWLVMTLVTGVSGGNALGGAVIDAAGWRAALLVTCGLGVAMALVALARRATLDRVYASAR